MKQKEFLKLLETTIAISLYQDGDRTKRACRQVAKEATTHLGALLDNDIAQTWDALGSRCQENESESSSSALRLAYEALWALRRLKLSLKD